MARKSKSKVQVEILNDEDNSWLRFKGGLSSMAEAEAWIVDNINAYGDVKLRAVKFSGVYEKHTRVVKR